MPPSNNKGLETTPAEPSGPLSSVWSGARGGIVPDRFQEPARLAIELAANRHADSTRRTYETAFARFAEWCDAVSDPDDVIVSSLPAHPAVVVLYLSVLVEHDNAAGYQVGTLEQRISAIRWKHESGGHTSPTLHKDVSDLMAGIRRKYGGRPPNKRDPLSTRQLEKLCNAIDDADQLTGLRDRALLLLGYTGAFRRSELASLQRHQLKRTGEGYIVELGRTKDDQEAKGRDVGIPAFDTSPVCPVAAIDRWLTVAGITEGPIFRRVTRYQTIGTKALSPGSVALIIKKRAQAASLPVDRLSGHSLRAGHATTAAKNGATDRTIMRQTGHKRTETLDGYVRPATLFLDNSADYLDL